MQSNEGFVLQGVLDSLQDMVRVLDLQRGVSYANALYREKFGDQVGHGCHEMFQSKRECNLCPSKLAIKTGSVHVKIKHFKKQKYLVRAAPVRNSKGEIIGVTEAFRDITKEKKEQEQLKEKNRMLLAEADFAARMQQTLFWSQGKPDQNVEMLSRYLPASSLGGDMFGCLEQKNGNICFYVADVSGHGLPAAVVTLFLASYLRGTKALSAAQVLQNARKAFLSLEQDEQLYVSMFTAILNPKTGELKWANAGLNAIPLLESGGKLMHLYSPAYPICSWEEDIVYKEHTAYMEEGAKLLLYTDGLLDERSSKLSEAALYRRMKRLDGEELLNSLSRQVLKQHQDDVCMLLITRKKKQEVCKA